MQRRRFNAGAAALAGAFASGCAALPPSPQQALFQRRVRAIEVASGGRLGVAIRNTASGAEYVHRGDERFPLTSTFKMLAAAAVLARVDQGAEQLARRVPVQAADIVTYSPVTQPRVGSSMTVAELCEAAVAISDNAAGNLLLRSFGGPAGLTAYVRTLGDPATRLDRWETELNEAAPGDPRDTTSPLAMLRTMDKLALGTALSPASREQLVAWLLANKVGATRLRARLPAGWRIADKTGAGGNGTNNDVGVLWPPGGKPVLVACYLTGSTVDGPGRDRAVADVGELAAQLVAA
jgi:beta-lactamase class A